MSFTKFLDAVSQGNLRQDIIGRDEFNGILIDTCFTLDTGKYETYIGKSDFAGVVEMYPNREEAIKGHRKYVALLESNPDIKLDLALLPIDWMLGNY